MTSGVTITLPVDAVATIRAPVAAGAADSVSGFVQHALDRVDATHVGRLLAATGTSDTADAHVVICARRARTSIVTSDPDGLRALDPALEIVTI